MEFNAKYYKDLISKSQNSSVTYSPLNFALPNMTLIKSQSLWICSDTELSKLLLQTDNILFSTGVGLSGIPHMGTVSQLLRGVLLQKNGLDVQIVLGDIDAYNGRGIFWNELEDLSAQYINFIHNIGFDSRKGTLRTQSSVQKSEWVTQAFISKYFSNDLLLNNIEDLHDFYVARHKVSESINFPLQYSLSLMSADFIAPLLYKNYDLVVPFLGIDEHGYVRIAMSILKMLKNEFAILDSKHISPIYSSIVKGFNGYPKMSKSFPNSSINLLTPIEIIREQIMHNEGEYTLAEDSVVYQLMTSLGNYNDNEILILKEHCENKHIEWEKDKSNFLERIIWLKECWNND